MNTIIKYPYLPLGRIIQYVPTLNEYMSAAQDVAREFRGELQQPNGVVVVKEGVIIGRGSIGMNYHFENGCERIKHNMPTGVGYDLCPGCSYENHGEANAIKDVAAHGKDAHDADLYLWGHWWCCEPCWKKMIDAGISNVYLLEGSEELFNKSSPNNIVGKDF